MVCEPSPLAPQPQPAGGGVAVIVGIGSALGAWFVAAMISLTVEIADSLREIVRLAE